MTKKKTEQKETHKHWTIELNIGSKRNMGKLKHSKNSGYYHSSHDLNTVREKVKNRFDGGSGNVIKGMFEYDGRYNDSDEKSFYISFTFYGGVDYIVIDTETKEPLPENNKLRFLPNALLTPHIGYVTAENYRIFYTQMIEALESCVSGKPIRGLK